MPNTTIMTYISKTTSFHEPIFKRNFGEKFLSVKNLVNKMGIYLRFGETGTLTANQWTTIVTTVFPVVPGNPTLFDPAGVAASITVDWTFFSWNMLAFAGFRGGTRITLMPDPLTRTTNTLMYASFNQEYPISQAEDDGTPFVLTSTRGTNTSDRANWNNLNSLFTFAYTAIHPHLDLELPYYWPWYYMPTYGLDGGISFQKLTIGYPSTTTAASENSFLMGGADDTSFHFYRGIPMLSYA